MDRTLINGSNEYLVLSSHELASTKGQRKDLEL